MLPVILSVDIGTTSLKAAFIDLDGNLKAFGRSAYKMGSEAYVWEKGFAMVLENLRSQKPDLKIDAICISGNGPTLVPVSREGEALPPLYWFNDATRPQKITTKSLFLPHVVSFREEAPSLYERAKFFFSSHEWLASRLGASSFTVIPQAAYVPYYWDDEQCRLFGLDIEKFPPFLKMGSPAGKVSSQAASLYGSLGLKSGIPIIAGAPDFISALIGTGALKSGDVCDRAGSSEGINFCAQATAGIEELRAGLRVLPHVKKGFINVSALIPVSGRLFDSYKTCTNQESRSYEALLAELIPPATDTSFFEQENEKTAPEADRLVEANRFLGRSVLCAIGFSVRRAVETLEGQGFAVKAMRVSGGQGKNPLWNQLKADITGVPLMIPEICDGELAGNAVLAACALQNRPATEEDFERVLDVAAERMIRFREEYQPRAETAPYWEERYHENFPSA